MKTKLIFLFCLLSIIGNASSNNIKIGYIDINHIILNSTQFIKSSNATVKYFQPQKDSIVLLTNKIELLKNNFSKNQKTLLQSEIASKIQKIDNLKEELRQKITSLQQQLSYKNKQEINKIRDLIKKAIEKVAIKEKFDLILYQNIAYANEKINITKLISKELELLNLD